MNGVKNERLVWREVMKNPWTELSGANPFVLEQDAPYVDVHNRLARGKGDQNHFLHLDVPPAPFGGYFDAPVVILLANPGYSQDDRREQTKKENLEVILRCLQSTSGAAFWPLTKQFSDTSAGRWWRSKTKYLAPGGPTDPNFTFLSERILSVELHGYHSKSWMAPRANFPSQEFNFELVRRAISNNSLIVISRSIDHWLSSVPQLMDYKNKITDPKSKRVANLSPGNLTAKDFRRIQGALS
jgi:hypothetical protein